MTPLFEGVNEEKTEATNPKEKKKRGRPPVIKTEEKHFKKFQESPKTLDFKMFPSTNTTVDTESPTGIITEDFDGLKTSITNTSKKVDFEQAKQTIIEALEDEYKALCNKAQEKQLAIQTIKSLMF